MVIYSSTGDNTREAFFGDANKGIRFIISKQDVESRLKLFNEGVFKQ